MHYDPHALHQILLRIQEQMRCPQCSTPVDVDLPSVKLAGDDFILLQLKCEACAAFIVLHVTLTGKQLDDIKEKLGEDFVNASSRLQVSEEELSQLRTALKEHNGSFSQLFKSVENSTPPTDDQDDKNLLA